ncbi:MAG: amidohydrolase family protein [Pyrinomonadaceae bacterium]|nr:amidohydrolase family protein [Pyrinomonadaceae bacterium]
MNRIRFVLAVFSIFAAVVLSPQLINGQESKDDKPKDAKKKPLPLEMSRKFEFTVSEGTWISLDVSPDGGTVAFDLLGDIYTIPISGGKAKLALGGRGFASQPRFSPDGKKLTFVSDRSGSNNLWIADANGKNPKQLSKEQQAQFVSPIWTPDGEYVIVSKSNVSTLGAYQLFMYHRLGGSGLKISKGSTAPAGGPPRPGPNELGAFPTKDKLFFARQAPRGGPGFTVRQTQIVKRELRNDQEDGITFLPGKAFRPIVSNDGKTLVFGSRFESKTGLRIRDLQSGDERWLKYPIQRDELESRPTRGLLPGYTFTPDDSAVLVYFGGKINRISVADGSIEEIPFVADVSIEGGPSLYVEHKLDEGPVKARLVQEPEVSSNGAIAFSALAAVYTLAPGTNDPVRLTNTSEPREFQPSWSKDGSKLTYVTWSTKGGHIWVRGSDDQPARISHKAAFYKDPVFTPDGEYIVALKTDRQTRVNHPSDFLGPQPGLDIVRMPVTGGNAEVIVPSRGLGKPHFGPEKDRVYVYGNRGLISYRFDGTDPKTHLRVVGKGRGPRPNPARDARISPDGKHVLARMRNGQLFLGKVPRFGGGVPTINLSAPAVPVKRLSTIGADSFTWADGGRTVIWTVGSTIYSRKLEEISFEKKKPEVKKDPTKTEAKDGENAKQKEKAPKEEESEESKARKLEVVVEKPRHIPKGTALLRGARVITMKGREVIEKADILIRNNRIAGIGKQGSLKVPSDAKVFDVSGKTIIPGIVDIHAHWEVRHSVLDTEDYTFLGNLAYGVTTGRDPQTRTNDTFAYQDLVDTGQMLGPRIFNTGPGVFSDTNLTSYKEARDTVARYKNHYRAETLKSYLVGNRKQRQWVAMASKELGIIPTTEGGSDFALNLTHAIDGFSGNEHSLPIVPIFDDVAQLYARSGITYTPTLVVAYGGPSAKYYFVEKSNIYKDPKLRRFNPQAVLDEKTARLPYYRDDEYIFPQIAAGANKILKAGGRIGVGGHGELQGLQCHWEMWGFAMGGMENHDVLRTATILGAEAIGFGKEFGSLEAGKLADLVVLDKNPLDDIKHTTAIRYVMKNGEMFEGETLDQVYPVQKKLPTMWWWNGDPVRAQ